MWELARLIRQHAEVLAEVESLDVGKPIVEARMDIAGSNFILNS